MRPESHIKHVAIGASHEIYPTTEAAARATAAQCVANRIAQIEEIRRRPDQRPRRSVVTSPILRSRHGGLDDLKFLYPVLDNIPVIVFPILSYALAGVQVSTYGPKDVGAVIDILRKRLLTDGLLDDPHRLVFVEEDQSHISLFDTLRRSTAVFDLQADKTILFSAGDLVLAYNVLPTLMDPHAATHDVVINLNAKQVVFPRPGSELFPRNYFDMMRLDDTPSNAVVDVKEPNVILFTAAGMCGLSKLDGVRHPPRGGTYVGVLVRAALGASLRAGPSAAWAFLRYGFHRGRGSLSPAHALSQRRAKRVAAAVIGAPTMVKAENADPFLLRDCDGFEDVFGYYRVLLQSIVDSGADKEAGYRKLAAYYPYASLLHRLSRDLVSLRSEIALWKHWPEFICDKISQLNARLAAELIAAGFAPQLHRVPQYFNSRGEFQYLPSIGDDLAATKRLLRGAYQSDFMRNRSEFLSGRSDVAGPGCM